MGGEGGAPLEALPALLALKHLVQAVDGPAHNRSIQIYYLFFLSVIRPHLE